MTSKPNAHVQKNEKKPLLNGIPELTSGWHIDQAILYDDSRLAIIRFGRPSRLTCKLMDDMLKSLQFKLINMAAMYFVDIDKVDDYNDIYDFGDDDDFAIMFLAKQTHNG